MLPSQRHLFYFSTKSFLCIVNLKSVLNQSKKSGVSETRLRWGSQGVVINLRRVWRCFAKRVLNKSCLCWSVLEMADLSSPWGRSSSVKLLGRLTSPGYDVPLSHSPCPPTWWCNLIRENVAFWAVQPQLNSRGTCVPSSRTLGLNALIPVFLNTWLGVDLHYAFLTVLTTFYLILKTWNFYEKVSLQLMTLQVPGQHDRLSYFQRFLYCFLLARHPTWMSMKESGGAGTRCTPWSSSWSEKRMWFGYG